MSPWELSIRRPIFMTSVLTALLVAGLFALKELPVELFPDVAFPVVTVSTVYPGASPNEIETLVTKPIEEEVSTLAGIKNIRSVNQESFSFVVTEFNLDVDVKIAEQQVRDRVSMAKRNLPDDVEEPLIRRLDPSDQPIMVIAIESDKKGGEFYDLANEVIRPQLEQVDQVGRVDIVGLRKREIQVLLDRKNLKEHELSYQQVASALSKMGENIPAGKLTQGNEERVYRTLGEFASLREIESALVSFYGNDVPVRLNDLGVVKDTLQDEKMRAYLNGEPAALLNIYKQSGANTVKVSNALRGAVEKMNLAQGAEGFRLEVIRDLAHFIRANIIDVTESILLGIFLTVIVVFLFLGSARSTFITGLAIPVSLIGGLPFLFLAGLSINVMTLLAFSLAVGLLIDDAIVVRENIFRHRQMGKSAVKAALDGTSEVALAVVAVSLAVIAVFLPIAFLSGVVGQFFKSFGLGVCFVMAVSLFDALTNASMLSAYFGGTHVSLAGFSPAWRRPIKSVIYLFEQFQVGLESSYERLLRRALKYKLRTLVGTLAVVGLLLATFVFIPKTFLPAQDSGEFLISLELAPGVGLGEMDVESQKVAQVLERNSDIESYTLTVGDRNGRSYVSEFYVKLKPFLKRAKTTTEIKAEVRGSLREFAQMKPKVKDVDFIAAGMRPFVINIRGQDLDLVRKTASLLYEKLKAHPGLLDPDITDKPGLPEVQVAVDKAKAQELGVSPVVVGAELRAQVEGLTPAKFRERGIEYDVRIRAPEDQRSLSANFNRVLVPNLNRRLVPLRQVAEPRHEVGFAAINRENRGRYVGIEADITPNGPGMGGVINDIKKWFGSGEVLLPPGVTYRFVGQAENFQELVVSIQLAGLLGIIFIFLVLASLYESVVTPFVIMLVIPLAVFGGFFGLFVAGSSLDLFSMIGCVMLMGLATKNSIILVDYIKQMMDQGLTMAEAIVKAGKTRLRPILMTSLALIVGMMPIAIGLNEASSQRRSLGIAVVGGVAISTLLTLIVIPVVFEAIEKFRIWMIQRVGRKLINVEGSDEVEGQPTGDHRSRENHGNKRQNSDLRP